MNKENRLPKFAEKFFWDIDPDSLEPDSDYFIIIERLLNYADDITLKWLLNYYDNEKIKYVVKNSRRLTPKTANFWQKHLNLRKEEVKCIKKSYLKMD